jgi:DDE superfamily endonuclease
MQRHKDITMRKASLIKRSRAELSHGQVNDFFDHYEKTAAGIPPENIINADETNLREDPGSQKAVFQQGVKYAEQIRDHSKSCVSIMFAGTASGHLLPPYVVYKAQYCYPYWCQKGPKGAFYTSTTSGWFDNFVFVEWMKNILIPYCRRLEGKKLLLVDNLASHISVEVIDLCKEHNIEFVCLPANSTDKMQPLDVGYFGPMKGKWREQLRKYQDKDPEAKLLKKTEFPAMLKELIGSLNSEQHLPQANGLIFKYQ